MYEKPSIYLFLFLPLLLTGCANSIYFYETEKISLTVEARPDSTQPVQGNLGIKQRVAMIVPRKSNDAEKDGEALSTVSSFDFRIKDDENFFRFNPILIRTAFVTGEAADKLYDKENPPNSKAAGVAKVLSSYDQALKEIRVESKRLDEIIAHVAKDSDIDSGKLDELINKAEKNHPNILTSTVKSKLRGAKKQSELKDLLFNNLDRAIYPLYSSISINQ